MTSRTSAQRRRPSNSFAWLSAKTPFALSVAVLCEWIDWRFERYQLPTAHLTPEFHVQIWGQHCILPHELGLGTAAIVNSRPYHSVVDQNIEVLHTVMAATSRIQLFKVRSPITGYSGSFSLEPNNIVNRAQSFDILMMSIYNMLISTSFTL